jgi:hypothetical protein
VNAALCSLARAHERAGQTVAEPVLYANIIVNNQRQLELLSSRILKSRDAQGQTVGRWIRTLDVRMLLVRGVSLLSSPAGRGFDSLVLVLCHTINLRSLRCNEYISPGILACLLQSAEASMEDLQISLSAKYSDAISTINCFRGLSSLKLKFPADVAVSFSDVTLALPKVRRFFLDWSPKDATLADPGVLQLAKSRFDEQCSIQLRMPTLSRESAFKLLPLFQTHKSAFVSLECPDEAILTLSGAIKSAPKLYFHDVVPPPKLFETGELPMMLFVSPPAAAMEKMWSLLDSLARRTGSSLHTTKLFIFLSAPLQFSWSKNTSEEEKLVVGTMLSHALALKKKGILIVDQDGDDLGSLLM